MARRIGRAYWKGFLRLSLVSIPVEIHNAVDSKSDIAFRQIHKPSGRRVRYQKVVPGVGPIDETDIVKGYEVDTDTYVTLEAEEIDALKLESKKTIDLVQFVDLEDIDYRYFERPYFVVPADDMAAEGYAVIREALRKSRKLGLGQVAMGGREWLVALAPLHAGLVLELIRYADELRKPEDYFAEVPGKKPSAEMIELAMELISKKSQSFDSSKYKDHYQTALRELVQAKLKGRKLVAPHEEDRTGGDNVVDLMEALRRSVGKASAQPARPKRPRKRA